MPLDASTIIGRNNHLVLILKLYCFHISNILQCQVVSMNKYSFIIQFEMKCKKPLHLPWLVSGEYLGTFSNPLLIT